MPYPLTGTKMSTTYTRLVQYVSGSFYDGVGTLIPTQSGSIITGVSSITSSNDNIQVNQSTGNVVVTLASNINVTASLALSSSTSVNSISSSYALTTPSASNALTASYIESVQSASYAVSASYAPGNGGTSLVTGSTYPITSSWALNVISASYALTTPSASNALTASYTEFVQSASYAVSASYAPNGGGTTLVTGSTYPITSSWALNTISASYALTTPSASTSLTAISSSTSNSSSYALISATASYIDANTLDLYIQGGNSFGEEGILGLTDSNSLSIITSGSKRIFISSSGDIGIGTNTPLYKLQVSGTIAPSMDDAFALGSPNHRFRDLYAAQTTIGAFFEVGLKTDDIGKNPTGTVVVWRKGVLVPCDKNDDKMVMGVVKHAKDEPIVLGAEHILVTGKIKEGDYISTSTKLGHGKAIKKLISGKVIAQALEDSDSDSNLIKAMIRKM
jgi:hypothetical protein